MSPQKNKDLDLDQQVTFLKKISFFHGFDDHELKQFLALSKWLRVPRRTMIIKEGTTERAFYILVKGEVKVQKHLRDGGKPLELTTLKTGDCFGEMALVTEIKRTADVVASEDSFLLRVEPEIVNTSNLFLQLKFYKRFCESLVTRLDIANKRLARTPDAEPEPSTLHEVLTVGLSGDPAPAVQKKATVDAGPRKTPEPAGRKTVRPAALPPLPSKDDRQSASKLHKRLRPDYPLPINPALAKELKPLLSKEADSDNTRRFADLISMDPVLSCAVIQTANSPYFRRAASVATVPHAMVIVGIKHVQEIVGSAIESSSNLPVFSGNEEVAASFWKHSVVVARIAELLKDVIQVQPSTDMHLAGLLHDLGILAIDGLSPDFYGHAGTAPELEDLVKAEKEYVGVDHGQAGVWLGEFLGLPHVYLDVMRYHHSPEKVSSTSALPVALVTLADLFATERRICMSKPKPEPEAVPRSFAWVLIQEQHKPFLDVNIMQFIDAFNLELDKSWTAITADMP